MRFAMIAAYGAADSLEPVREDLTLFNCEVMTFGVSVGADGPDQTTPRFSMSVEALLDELVFNGPWDGVLVAVNALTEGPLVPQDAVKRLARRIRVILGPQLPVGVVDDVSANVPRQLFDGIMALWFLRVVALDAADHAPGR